jgi:RHS repeat-associated protein
MLRTRVHKAVLMVFVLFAGTCIAQVTTGVPPYQSLGGGPDVINLGNLNVHYSIPVFGRAGRGTPFNYSLAYDSSIWTAPSGSWIPASNWGLHRDMAALVGYVQYGVSVRTCTFPDGGTGDRATYSIGPYVDAAGTSHQFHITLRIDDCDQNVGPQDAVVVINDGSGITVSAGTPAGYYRGDPPDVTLTFKSGEAITPPLLGGASLSGTGTSVDSNGNKITSAVNGSTTTFTDTLGTTALTITGTAPNPVYYKYTAPSGALASVTATYKSYTVQTKFQCSGINEYGPLSNSLPDKITLPDGSLYQFAYEVTPDDTHNPHYVTGRIASITLPTGATISYAYTGGNNGIICADGSTSGFDRTTPDGTWHYLRTGTSPAYTTTITTPTDPKTGQTNQTVVNFQGNYEVGRQVYQGSTSGTLLETVYTCYNGNGVSNPSSCVTTAVATPFSQITAFRQLNSGQFAEVDTHYDGYGNVTETDQYDFGGSTPTQKTLIAYDSTLGNGIVDHPSSVIVEDGANNLKSKTTYAYDETTPQATSGTPQHVAVICNPGYTKCRGNTTTVTTYSSATSTLIRSIKYYDTGNVYQSQDVNGQWTTFTYGACGNSFLTSVSMPLSLSKSMTWNCTGGVATSATDENGKVSYTNYTTDTKFWRPESTKDALLNITSLTYASLKQSRGHLDFNGTTSTVDITSTLDSLGRAQYSQRKQGPSSTYYDTVQQTYDTFGRPFQVTVPYVANTTTNPTPPGGTPTTTTYYDAMGRPIQVIDGGGGTVNTTYNQNLVYSEIAPAPTVPPAPATENTKRKQLQYDGLGRLTSVCEITSEATYSGTCNQTTPVTGYWTTYAYDTISPTYNSLTVTQNVQRGTSQTRTYVYDMLRRLISETNPETSNLAYSYTYDSDGTCGTSNGDLVKRVDANGNVTCYAYDALHRLTSVTYPSGPNSASTAKKYFVYDTATVNGQAMINVKNRLAEAYTCTSCPGTKITDLGYSYSARGEVTDVYESTPHSSGYYHLTASYFAHGALNALGGVPQLPTIYYGGNSDSSGLDGEGRYLKVTASSGQNPVSGLTYTNSGTTQPIGSLTAVTLGSLDNDSFSYDPNTGRLTQYNFNIGVTPQTVQGNLTWNANGTLVKLAITDPFDTTNNQTCTFGYDDLARVTSANCGTPWNQTYTFDPFGNITKSGTISFQPGYDQTKNWFTSLPGLSYDNNGNLKNDSFHQYTWDSENNPLSIDSVNVTFDALGRMIEQARGSSYTQIIYSPTGGKLALMNGQSLQKAFVGLPGGAAAVYNSSGIAYYRHSDWLGSSRFASTTSRTKYFDVAYAPYGEDYGNSGTTDLSFTGQNQDTVSGLYDFMYREYHPVSGRWIQPDPAGLGVANPTNPQTWNRYAYVANTPLDSVDPFGLWIWCSDACNYLRSMARTAAFFERFRFFSSSSDVDIWLGWKGSDIAFTQFIPVDSPGDSLAWHPFGDGWTFGGSGTLTTYSFNSPDPNSTTVAPQQKKAANNFAQKPPSSPPKPPDPNNYHCALLSSSADIGVCTFTCVPPDGMGGDIARIPVYVIQKACNTTNRSCPIALDVYPPSHWGPFEFGRPKVVPNSCVYGKVQ